MCAPEKETTRAARRVFLIWPSRDEHPDEVTNSGEAGNFFARQKGEEDSYTKLIFSVRSELSQLGDRAVRPAALLSGGWPDFAGRKGCLWNGPRSPLAVIEAAHKLGGASTAIASCQK